MAGRNIIVSGLITGALVGIAAGVLLAPKSGRVTRRFVKGKTNDFKSRMQSYASKLRLRFNKVQSEERYE